MIKAPQFFDVPDSLLKNELTMLVAQNDTMGVFWGGIQNIAAWSIDFCFLGIPDGRLGFKHVVVIIMPLKQN